MLKDATERQPVKGVHKRVVVVTRPEYVKAESVFTEKAEDLSFLPGFEEEMPLADLIRDSGASHAIVGTEKYSAELYQALPRGGVVARFGVGHDGIDKVVATEAGLFCTNTPAVLEDSVPENAAALLLAAARWLPFLAREVRQGQWAPRMGIELNGKTLAVIGCGAVGCRMARIAAVGLEMRVIGCARREVSEAELKKEFGFRRIVRDFSLAVKEADFVSLHIPSTLENDGFINREAIAKMSSSAWLINTSRGSLVDESALYQALTSGQLAGAALDVFEREPYQPVSGLDLRTLPNVIMTPHVSSSTVQASDRMANKAIQNIRLKEQGDFQRMDLLNPEVLSQ